MAAQTKPQKQYRQAQHIIDKCGGVKATAALVGRHYSWVLKWTYPKDRGGRGGLIPDEDQQVLMLKARKGMADLCPSDFFPIEHPEGNLDPAP